MSPRPKKAPAAATPKSRPIRRSPPRAVAAPRDASAPDYSRTPLDAIPLAGLPPRALIAPNFRLYELSKSDLAARLGIDNGFASEAHLRAAIHLARQVLQPIRDAFGSFSPNSVYRSQHLERALKNKPASWLSTSQTYLMATMMIKAHSSAESAASTFSGETPSPWPPTNASLKA